MKEKKAVCSFSDILKTYRTTRRTTRGELAEELGVSVHTIISYELDRCTPSLDVVRRVAQRTGLDEGMVLRSVYYKPLANRRTDG